MAGLVLVGAMIAIQAAHAQLQEARSPLITLPLQGIEYETPPPTSRKLLKRIRSSSPTRVRVCGGGVTTISKHSLKILAGQWQERYWDVRYRILEIQRSAQSRGWDSCWAGNVDNLIAMKLAMAEADDIRRRLTTAVDYLRSLPAPFQPTSLNPLHRRGKTILPLSALPPSLNGLPVPLPRPPKLGDYTPVLETDLPDYAGPPDDTSFHSSIPLASTLTVDELPSYELVHSHSSL